MARSAGASRIIKYRGVKFRGGYHDVTIATGGLNVFPRLVASEFRGDFVRGTVSSGIGELDQLLGGGIETGSSTLILGPAGTGKSLVAIVFLLAAIARGEKAAMFVFDEELGLLFARMKGLGIDLEAMQRKRQSLHRAGRRRRTVARRIRPPVRKRVDEDDIKTVVIDSLNGYQAAMPEENSLILHMHELLQYLNRRGAATFMTVAQHGLVGDMKAPVDVTYLADTVILLRYFEALGTVRRAMSIIKKRTGAHESTIREYRIDGRGLTIGEPLDGFQGVLRGVPVYVGEGRPLAGGADRREARPLFRAGRHSRAEGPRCRGRRRADQGGGLSTPMSATISPRCMHEIESGAGLAVIADEAIKTADLRGLVQLAQRSGAMVGFSDRVADASGRRSRAQSGRGAARAVARQRHLSSSARFIRPRW